MAGCIWGSIAIRFFSGCMRCSSNGSRNLNGRGGTMFTLNLAVFLLGIVVGVALMLCFQLKGKRDELTRTIDEWKKAIQKDQEEYLKQINQLTEERREFEKVKQEFEDEREI